MQILSFLRLRSWPFLFYALLLTPTQAQAQELEQLGGLWEAELTPRLMVMNGDSLRLPAAGQLELAVEGNELVGHYHVTINMATRQSKQSLDAVAVVEGQTLILTLSQPNSTTSLEWMGTVSMVNNTLKFPSELGRGFPPAWNQPITFRRPDVK